MITESMERFIRRTSTRHIPIVYCDGDGCIHARLNYSGDIEIGKIGTPNDDTIDRFWSDVKRGAELLDRAVKASRLGDEGRLSLREVEKAWREYYDHVERMADVVEASLRRYHDAVGYHRREMHEIVEERIAGDASVEHRLMKLLKELIQKESYSGGW